MFKNNSCYHCNSSIPHNTNFVWNRSLPNGTQSELRYCCHGCETVSRIIYESGNDRFYDIRGSQILSPILKPEEDKKIRKEYLNGELVREEYIREIETNNYEVHIAITNIHCSACVWLNEKVLTETNGVLYTRINYATGRAEIQFDPSIISLSEIFEAIESIGYLPRLYSPWKNTELHSKNKSLLIRMGVAGFFFGNIMLFGTALYAGYFTGIEMEYKRLLHYLSWALATPVYLYSGFPFLQGAWMGLKNRRFSMDFLLVTGISLAYFYSVHVTLTDRGEVYFDSVCMIYFFILLGKYLEDNARIRAADKLTGLLASIPEVATVLLESGEEKIVRSSEIKKFMILLIRNGERVPVDGVLLSERSYMDESFLTGESKPLTKIRDENILAGSINTGNPIQIIADSDSKNSTLSRLKILIEKAMGGKPKLERITDRISGYFIAIVFLLATCTFFYWNYCTQLGLENALVNTIAVLIVACPCALGLAVPTALVMNHIRNSKAGVIIKNPDSVETLANITEIFLDKTGTITEGKPRLTYYKMKDIIAAITYTKALEKYSHHPIAKSLVKEMDRLTTNPLLLDELKDDEKLQERTDIIPISGLKKYYKQKNIEVNLNYKNSESSMDSSQDMVGSFGNNQYSELSKENVREVPGLGMEASLVNGKLIRLGSAKFLGVKDPQGYEDRTCIHLSIGEEYQGYWILEDRLRESTILAIRNLYRDIPRITLLSGDSNTVVKRIAESAGIQSYMGEINPEGKLLAIQSSQESGYSTAMVGDGINDSAALAKADIGISMGIAADLSLDKSDVILVQNDLRCLTQTILYAKETRKRIIENMGISFLYNSVMLPLAALGLMSPVICAVFMASSSLTVVGNSLRLREKDYSKNV